VSGDVEVHENVAKRRPIARLGAPERRTNHATVWLTINAIANAQLYGRTERGGQVQTINHNNVFSWFQIQPANAKTYKLASPNCITTTISSDMRILVLDTCWRHGSVGRTSVFGWRTFPDLCLIYASQVTTSWVRCPLWVSQPGHSGCTVQARAHGLLPATTQPYAALLCRLMVSTPTIHVVTWITTHLPTQQGWKAELACLSHSRHFTHEGSHRSGIDQGKSASQRPTS